MVSMLLCCGRCKRVRKPTQKGLEYQISLAGMMCKLLSPRSAPNVDFDVFDDNPLEFNYFMSIFEEMVETRVVDPRGRLTHLINYTKGEAKELVKHCIQQPTEVCYDNAKHLLMRRYGDPHKILSAYCLEIKNGHK